MHYSQILSPPGSGVDSRPRLPVLSEAEGSSGPAVSGRSLPGATSVA